MADFYSAVDGFHNVTFGPIFYYAYDGQPGGSGLTDPSGALLPDAKAVLGK